MALRSAQLLTEGGRCLGLTLPSSFAECLDVWEPQPPGTLWACNRAVGRMLYLPFKMKYNVCLPKNLSLLYEYFEILCGLCWIKFYRKLLANKILVLWRKPCIFLTTYQVTRCHNRWTPTKLTYRIWMVNCLRFNLGTLQNISGLLSHAHTQLSYCPQVSLYFNCSMYFYNHFMRFVLFVLLSEINCIQTFWCSQHFTIIIVVIVSTFISRVIWFSVDKTRINKLLCAVWKS
jgi:hypothetical protein